ncbi:rRNA maturation RNase YbeY [Dermabacter hominis]|uniref:rRNA maturation RNase YbeY n=1 Tax=Dermabacter hominis TaxID=36740 RepID=UPI000773D2BF|nr:rRNA maturation RNase YbeY [Dermabacter hominis]
MSIEVNNETTAQIDAREFVDLARYVFEAMFLHPATELSITFVDEKAMSELHEEWMDLEGPTDVMSFPMDELREGREGELAPEGLLGDIVICPTVAAQQARIAGHSSEEEMLLLLTHGILHLLGYDHVEPEEERVMFTLQRKLLLTFLAGRGSRVGICDTGGPDA